MRYRVNDTLLLRSILLSPLASNCHQIWSHVLISRMFHLMAEKDKNKDEARRWNHWSSADGVDIYTGCFFLPRNSIN